MKVVIAIIMMIILSKNVHHHTTPDEVYNMMISFGIGWGVTDFVLYLAEKLYKNADIV